MSSDSQNNNALFYVNLSRVVHVFVFDKYLDNKFFLTISVMLYFLIRYFIYFFSFDDITATFSKSMPSTQGIT